MIITYKLYSIILNCVNRLRESIQQHTGREVSSVDVDTRSGLHPSSVDFCSPDSSTADPAVYCSTGSLPVPFSMSNPKGL